MAEQSNPVWRYGKKSPNFAPIRNEYGIALAGKGKKEEAIKQFETAAKLPGYNMDQGPAFPESYKPCQEKESAKMQKKVPKITGNSLKKQNSMRSAKNI